MNTLEPHVEQTVMLLFTMLPELVRIAICHW
jgi:hypothetical protein